MPTLAWFLTITLSTLAAFTHADTPYFSATYKGKHIGIPVTIVRSLKRDKNDIYHYKLDATAAVGSIKETSQFILDDAKTIIPLKYNYIQSLFGIKRTRKMDFDWPAQKATYVKNKKKEAEHPLHYGILDHALAQLQLRRDLYSNTSDLNYDFIEKHKFKSIRFVINEKESQFKLQGNTEKAWIIELIHDKTPARKTFITVLPEHFFAIAKINQTEPNGDNYTVTLESLQTQENAQEFFQLNNKKGG